MSKFLYKGRKTSQISFPLGGIGTGSIGFSGNGRLVDWEIFNRPAKGSSNGHTHFSIRAEREGKVIDARVMQGDLLPPYTGTLGKKMGSFGDGPPRQWLAGTPHFRVSSFRGEFPLASLYLEDEDFPGNVRLNAFNPFIPINDKDSGIPGAFFEIEILNTTESVLRYTGCFCVNNPHPIGMATNSFECQENLSMIRMASNAVTADDPLFGDMTVATDSDEVSYQEHWHRIGYQGRWVDDVNAYWYELNAPGKFDNNTSTLDSRGAAERSNHCLLAAHIDVAPGESGKIKFILTWSFPNCTNYWRPELHQSSSQEDFSQNFTDRDDGKSGTYISNNWRNYYSTIWKDASTAARYGLSNWEQLLQETKSFRNALFSSSLPTAVIDAISSNLSILKSSTVLRLEDGTFYGWEGCHDDVGCCEGSCTHVWNYAYALPFLFPQLERSMRDAEYRYTMGDGGGMTFRLQLPLDSPRLLEFRPCVDGQFGGVIKVYREWKISGDSEWLSKLWPMVRESLSFAWALDNPDMWDLDQNGVLDGRQHNTLDAELFGPSSWLNGFYLAALKAAAEIADHLGRTDDALMYQSIFEKGKKWVDENLFNGEYYHQRIDIHDKKILERFLGVSSQNQGTDRTESNIYWDDYWDNKQKQIMYQVGEGCGIDQVIAQWHANNCGLGEIFDKQHTATALQSIYDYNFVRGMRQVFNRNRRTFSLNDESGVLICSYPREEPSTPLPFAAETMPGFEYQFACHLIQEGFIDHGLEVVEAIRERFDGEKRNPWNEFECGSNYARSMASYSLLLSLSGFEYDMTKGMIGFNPKQTLESHQYFWCLRSAWGTVEINENALVLRLSFGTLPLRKLKSKMFSGQKKPICQLDGKPIDYEIKDCTLTFNDLVDLEKGYVFRVEL